MENLRKKNETELQNKNRDSKGYKVTGKGITDKKTL
jgi:hypothetical protein